MEKKYLDYERDNLIPIYEDEFKVGFNDIGKMLEVKNTALLKDIEISAMDHVDDEGWGFKSTTDKGVSWVITAWKVEILKRLKYAEKFKIKTWRHDNTRIRAYRDFEVIDSKGEIVAKASSLWVIIDVETRKVAKMPDETVEKFNKVNMHVFEDIDLGKIDIPDSFDKEVEYTIRKRDLDLNGHVNNNVYFELAYELIPEHLYENKDFSKFEINYKKEIKAHSHINICYKEYEDSIVVAFYNKDKTRLHAICKLYK